MFVTSITASIIYYSIIIIIGKLNFKLLVMCGFIITMINVLLFIFLLRLLLF